VHEKRKITRINGKIAVFILNGLIDFGERN